MNKEVFKGSGVALVTPFANGAVDFEALAKLIDFQLEGGTDAFIVLGTTGEPATMTAEEKKQVAQFAIKRIAGRVPVILGAGGNNTAAVIDTCKEYQTWGADALLVVTPYYNKCTQNGLIAHYTAVCAATELPVIAYNVPGRTGVNIQPATMAKLADISNMAGIKEASGNIEQISETARLVEGKCYVWSGDDGITLPIMAVGGVGVISVVANAAPSLMHKLCDDFANGRIAEARALQLKLLPFVKAMFSEVNPIPAKMAMHLMGFCSPEMRLPLTTMEQPNADKLAAVMRELQLI